MIRLVSGRKRRRLRARRGSVSVEFALVTVFFLFPLIAGSIDMVLILSARAKLNSALHAIYMFAWSEPGSADDIARLQGVIQAIDPALPASSITLNRISITSISPFNAIDASGASINLKLNTPATVNVCLSGATGIIDQGATAVLGAPPSGGPAAQSGTGNICLGAGGETITDDVPAVLAVYSLSSVVQLPVPVPFLPNPFTMTASGTIQVE